MKSLLIILTSLCLFSMVRAQKDTALLKSREVWYEPTPKGMSFLAAGTYTRTVYKNNDTIILKETIAPFWMSNEITNKEFREFTHALEQNPKDSLCWNDYQKATSENADISQIKNNTYRICKSYADALKNIIDTSIFRNEDKAYKNYFNNKAFDDYPVVGVSYKGATYYCIWKTITINKELNVKEKNNVSDFRLPCEEEWYYAASAPQHKPQVAIGKLQKVLSGERNKNGLFHFSDNVAEWTSTISQNNSNIVLGGSWKDYSVANKSFIFDKDSSANYIGFRIVRSYGIPYRTLKD